eukprot:823177-Pleurochrysis_carterae.AAC.1
MLERVRIRESWAGRWRRSVTFVDCGGQSLRRGQMRVTSDDLGRHGNVAGEVSAKTGSADRRWVVAERATG